MHTDLTYKDKLKIFHDNFISYAWSYIERHKAIASGREISVITTAFKDSLSSFRIFPVVEDVVDFDVGIAIRTVVNI